MKRIKDESGVWRETDEDVHHVIYDYFATLFREGGMSEWLTARKKVRTVTEEQNNDLMQPVAEEEVKRAVFAMYPEKSPGMDGLNPAFFQVYWDIVKDDVTSFCRSFFETGVLPEGLNRTLDCLIPKVKKSKHMTDVRPISLCNILVRIFSKVMTNRLKSCLKSLISGNQSAFIEGRLLSDNALIAYEINHFLRRKTQGKCGVAGLKIDISKAYDRLEWSFVEHMLNKFGFHSSWISRIMTCVTSVSYSFLHKGVVFRDVRPQRGIMQGDPISPYLYILCAKGLSAIIRRFEECNLFHGCKIARGAPSVSHLLFAVTVISFLRRLKQKEKL